MLPAGMPPEAKKKRPEFHPASSNTFTIEQKLSFSPDAQK